MRVERIDYHDMRVRHGYYQPVYRIDFWTRPDPPPGGDPEKMGWVKTSYRVSEAKSVREVRAWAEENANGQTFVLWTELGPADDRTLVRIEGVDPTNPNKRHLAE
jgi:hypothetical protein